MRRIHSWNEFTVSRTFIYMEYQANGIYTATSFSLESIKYVQKGAETV